MGARGRDRPTESNVVNVVVFTVMYSSILFVVSTYNIIYNTISVY